MSNLVKKKIEFDYYVMFFDMRSIAMYQAEDKSFIKGYGDLVKLKDDAILDFIACTLRPKDKPNEPIGFEEIKKDPINFLINYWYAVFQIVNAGFQEDNVKKKT